LVWIIYPSTDTQNRRQKLAFNNVKQLPEIAGGCDGLVNCTHKSQGRNYGEILTPFMDTSLFRVDITVHYMEQTTGMMV